MLALLVRMLKVGWTATGPFRSPSVGATYGGGIAGFILAPAEARMDFYDATSQIIPVLLLVLGIELRVVRLPAIPGLPRRDRPPGRALSRTGLERSMDQLDDVLGNEFRRFQIQLMYLGVFVLLVVALFGSLRPLATGVAADGNPRLVFAAIGAAVTCIAVVVLLRDRPAS